MRNLSQNPNQCTFHWDHYLWPHYSLLPLRNFTNILWKGLNEFNWTKSGSRWKQWGKNRFEPVKLRRLRKTNIVINIFSWCCDKDEVHHLLGKAFYQSHKKCTSGASTTLYGLRNWISPSIRIATSHEMCVLHMQSNCNDIALLISGLFYCRSFNIGVQVALYPLHKIFIKYRSSLHLTFYCRCWKCFFPKGTVENFVLKF